MSSGADRISDYPLGKAVVVVCTRCAGRGVLKRDCLTAQHGNIALPSLLTTLA